MQEAAKITAKAKLTLKKFDGEITPDSVPVEIITQEVDLEDLKCL